MIGHDPFVAPLSDTTLRRWDREARRRDSWTRKDQLDKLNSFRKLSAANFLDVFDQSKCHRQDPNFTPRHQFREGIASLRALRRAIELNLPLAAAAIAFDLGMEYMSLHYRIFERPTELRLKDLEHRRLKGLRSRLPDAHRDLRVIRDFARLKNLPDWRREKLELLYRHLSQKHDLSTRSIRRIIERSHQK